MREYITELSRYIIPALMAVYTLCSFACLVEGTAWKQGAPRSTGIYTIQNIIMFFLQLLMFTDLALVSGDMEYVFFYVFVQVFLLAAVAMVPVIYEKANRLLLNNMCMLMGTGLCVISRISFNQAVRQYIIVLLSLAVSLFIPWILSQIHFLKKLTWLYGIAGIVMLGMVLLYSEVTYGAEISFTIGGLTFQPSDLAKLGLIAFFAESISKKREKMRDFKEGFLYHIGILLVMVVMTALEPHFSGAILIAGIGAAMLVVGGIHWGWIAAGVSAVGLGTYLLAFTDVIENFFKAINYNASRIAVIVTLLLSFLVSLKADGVMAFINNVLGAMMPGMVLTLIIGRLWSKRVTKAAGLSSMIGGTLFGLAYLLIPSLSELLDSVFSGPAIPCAILTSVICVAVTLCTKRSGASEEEILTKVLDGRTDL